MKIALYIAEGLEQLVLTPETKHETALLEKLSEPRSLEIHRGSFYECQGGWVRQEKSDTSTIIVLRQPKGDPHNQPESNQ